MIRNLAWIELSISIVLLVLTIWPISGLCSGRLLGNDCESWFIFGVNIFGPLGLLTLVCSIWSLKEISIIPQFVLIAGFSMLMIYWFSHI